MRKIEVPFRNGHLTLSRIEAERLVQDVTRGLDYLDNIESQFAHAGVSRDGFMTRENFYEFFGPIYPDRATLRNHAGKLFGRLVGAVHQGLLLRVMCDICGRAIDEECTEVYSHFSPSEFMKIDVGSLKECAEQFMRGNYRHTGPSVIKDLRILLERL